MIRFSNSSKNSAQSTEEQARMSAAKFKSAAFDTVSFAMMTIDRNFNITYMNKGVIKLFQDNIDTFRAVWPNFDPERLIGQSIDSFHKNPAHQRKILSNPREHAVSCEYRSGKNAHCPQCKRHFR
jgi:methyl-accepting chemotaxis protein